MITQFIDIKTTDGICDAFIAYPAKIGKYPAVLFIMDGFGPRESMYTMAQTIAAKGYYVLLPNMFYRIRKAPLVDIKFPAKPEDMPTLVKQLMAMFSMYSPELGLKDIGVFLNFLRQQKHVAPGKIGCSGYCFGGGLAIRAAARYPDRFAATASFHAGNLATDKPDSPHLLLKQITAELYIASAGNDQSMPPEQISRLKTAIKEAGIRCDEEVYQGALHGFTMADLPAYNESAAARHWDMLFDLLKRNLSGADT